MLATYKGGRPLAAAAGAVAAAAVAQPARSQSDATRPLPPSPLPLPSPLQPLYGVTAVNTRLSSSGVQPPMRSRFTICTRCSS